MGCVHFYLISVSKMWDMIIRLCMRKGPIGLTDVLDSTSPLLTTNECNIVLPVIVK